jgi:hypothetical protein
MAKFSVDVKEVWCHTVEVELPAHATREEIVAAVNEKVAEGHEEEMEYSHTLDPDTWAIRCS